MQTQQNNSQSLPTQPLVSFIITYYNLPPHLLGECIDSILRLPLHREEREIIVVDDGSDKSPIDELKQYGEEVIYLWQKNKGLSEARNTGIQMTRGEYLQFVDGDDQLVHNPYGFCLKLVREKRPEMVVFNYTHNPETTKSNKFDVGEPRSGSNYMRHQNIHGMACGYIFKRSTLGDLRFTPGIYNEDEEFTPLLLLRAERIYVTNAKAYLYRRRTQSITTDRHLRKRLKRLNDTKHIIYRLKGQVDRLAPKDRTALQRRIAQLTMDYIYHVISETRSRHYLNRQLEELRNEGLFPLPDRHYTIKYTWFRRMTNSPKGLGILMRTIPFLNKKS